jgi:hypothetical protein
MRRDRQVQEAAQRLHGLTAELAELARTVDRLSAELLREWTRCRALRRRLSALEQRIPDARPARRG